MKPGQNITKCPKCSGSSIVHPKTEKQIFPMSPRKSPRPFIIRKGFSLETDLTKLKASQRSPQESWKLEMQNKNKTIASEYGECTRIACGFKFCTNCHNEQHMNSVCPVKPLSTSPTTSDEDSPQKTAVRRSKRNRLRRLRN